MRGGGTCRSPNGSHQREAAYGALRRRLILQSIPYGQRLREAQWARELGVNRAALREAFARLEAEGLIARGPGSGYIVPVLDENDMREILQVRTVLECAAIEQIVAQRRNTRRLLQHMRQACVDLRALLNKSYLLGASEADRRFHESLINAADSRRLAMIYHRAPLPMLHRRVAEEPHWREECQKTLAEHEAILKAIGAGQASRAQRLLRKHLSERYLLPLSH
jgi:DNA-binding GntR family transcriptional regulator